MKNYKGETRKVGVELEFHGLTPEKAAAAIAPVVEGDIEKKNKDSVCVQSSYGEFQFETDARFLKKLSEKSEKNKTENTFDIDGQIREFLSAFSKEVVPTELISPPLEISDLKIITKIQKKLHEKGAQGSMDSSRFAFGAQLNPEIVSKEADILVRQFQSFLILDHWLKNQIQVDTTRSLTFFAADFPKDYSIKVLDESYSPSFEKFIEDYLHFNPTRNRSLDMLPLFRFFEKDLVDKKVSNQKINARPTYHYRLPNCQIGMRSWSIEIEWKRWMLVEKLAECEELFTPLKRQLHEKLTGKKRLFDKHWLMELNSAVESLRDA